MGTWPSEEGWVKQYRAPGACRPAAALHLRLTSLATSHCSVGAHVRDAAAYVCWAFARAYTPEALGAAAGQLAPALICLACYDREVNCRRAAAAAYQVGLVCILSSIQRHSANSEADAALRCVMLRCAPVLCPDALALQHGSTAWMLPLS